MPEAILICLWCKKESLIARRRPKAPKYNNQTWLYCTRCERYQLMPRWQHEK